MKDAHDEDAAAARIPEWRALAEEEELPQTVVQKHSM
jgi:hypothetical protein